MIRAIKKEITIMTDKLELITFQCLGCGKDLEMPKSKMVRGGSEFETIKEFPWLKQCPDCNHWHKYNPEEDKVASADSPS